MKKYIFPILLWFPFIVIPMIPIAVITWSWSSGDLLEIILICGPLFLIISGILWIVNRIKFSKYNPSEKDAEKALATEIEAIKGNLLKKKLVKRKLVREYIEKRHLEASQNTEYLKSEYLSKLAHNFLYSGLFLSSPYLFCILLMILNTVKYTFTTPTYESVMIVILYVLTVILYLWKRYCIATLVLCLTILLNIPIENRAYEHRHMLEIEKQY